MDVILNMRPMKKIPILFIQVFALPHVACLLGLQSHNGRQLKEEGGPFALEFWFVVAILPRVRIFGRLSCKI